MVEALDTPVSSGLTACDAQYLLLVRAMRLPLATLDRGVLEAMKSAGISRFEP